MTVVLVTGAEGQLGRETVLALQSKGFDVVGLGRKELDFIQPERVSEIVADHKADWVINCAAYTQVDKAEQEQHKARVINGDSAGAVAEGVKSYGGNLVHISTDFVFAGNQSRPYKESDSVNPTNVYGETKLVGEQKVLAILERAIVLRTSWVYGLHGNNFVKTMLRLATERNQLQVVNDQIGTPTWTSDIVDAILALLVKPQAGLFHFSNSGEVSWYDFAVEIIAKGKQLGFPIKTEKVLPIPSSSYPTAARRPAYSVLDKAKIDSVLDYPIPNWSVSLDKMMKGLV